MKKILETLFAHQKLTKEQACKALVDIATGNANDTQVAALITVFLMRKISLEELNGFREALMSLCQPLDLSEFDPMDVCGTGGDNKNTFNISTTSAFVAAGAGVRIAKHGNYAVSSACGSSNILEYYGYKFSNDTNKLKSEIETSGICILHAPLFHTALKNFSGIRKDMQFKTFFNMLGPLINPSQPNKQLVGVYSMELADLYAGIYKQTDKEFSIIHSLDGYDEVSLTGSYRIIKRGSDEILKPETSGFKKLNASTISGGNTIIESAKIFHDILNCEGTREQQDVVIANASLAINCYYPDLSITDSIAMAKESLLSKRALKSFQKLMN